jgi:hypothetical protein
VSSAAATIALSPFAVTTALDLAIGCSMQCRVLVPVVALCCCSTVSCFQQASAIPAISRHPSLYRNMSFACGCPCAQCSPDLLLLMVMVMVMVMDHW